MSGRVASGCGGGEWCEGGGESGRRRESGGEWSGRVADSATSRVSGLLDECGGEWGDGECGGEWDGGSEDADGVEWGGVRWWPWLLDVYKHALLAPPQCIVRDEYTEGESGTSLRQRV